MFLTSTRCEEGEEQISELKRELQDVEGVLADGQIEMSSLHEQLTEVCVCVYDYFSL